MTLLRTIRGGLVLGLLLGCAMGARADYISSTLGSAGGYSILTLNGANDIALNGPGSTTGNVGISSGTLSLDASSGNQAINGNLYLGNNATATHTSTQVTGSVFTNQSSLLNQANTDARNASATFAGLTPTLSVPGNAVSGNTTINGTAGVNVVNLTGIHLGNGQSLTLNGPAGSQFVINDSGDFKLNSGHINLTGGVTANDVVLNATGKGSDLSTSGGLNNESVINGTILAPDRGVAFSPGLVNGELIAGGNTIHLVSGGSVQGVPHMVPEPASMVLMGLGGLSLTFLGARRRQRKTTAA